MPSERNGSTNTIRLSLSHVCAIARRCGGRDDEKDDLFCRPNFYWALQSPALADCTLAMFDEPGTGLSEFRPNAGLNVSSLAEMTQIFADRVLPGPYWLAGASMGGLISLLLLRRAGPGRVQGLINLEGNLCPEDCMFSRRIIPHTLDTFAPLFDQMMRAGHSCAQCRQCGTGAVWRVRRN